jgi:hypothetical protein
LGVETKRTEPFTATGGYNSKPSYRRLSTRAGSPCDRTPWKRWVTPPGASFGVTTCWWTPFANAPLDTRAGGRLLVIHHQRDAGCVSAFNGYQQLLTERSTHDLLKMSIEQIVTGLKTVVSSSELGWVEAFDRRYGDLSESQHLIEAT